MEDETENIRREQLVEINSNAGEREILEARYGEVYDRDQLSEHFVVTGFMAPYVGVVRKSDNQRGSLQFQHSPRYYFNFVADK